MTRQLWDSNVWLALSLSAHVHHAAARELLDKIEQTGEVLLCRPTQHTLLRLLTTAAVMTPYGIPPLTNADAWSVYEALMSDDRIGMADEPAGLQSAWREFALRRTPSPKLWMDSYLAAFARAAGLRMVTSDAAFRQFPGLDLLVLGDE